MTRETPQPDAFPVWQPFGRWTRLLAALCPVSIAGWIAMVVAGAVTAWGGGAGPLPFSALWTHLALAGLGAMTVLTSGAALVSHQARQIDRLEPTSRSADEPLPPRLLTWRVDDTPTRLAIVSRPGPVYLLVPVALGWTLLTIPMAAVLVGVRVLVGREHEFPVAVVLWVGTSAALVIFMAMRRAERLIVDRAGQRIGVEWQDQRQPRHQEVGFRDVVDVTVGRQKDRRCVLRLDLADGTRVSLCNVAAEQVPVLDVLARRVLAVLGRDTGEAIARPMSDGGPGAGDP